MGESRLRMAVWPPLPPPTEAALDGPPPRRRREMNDLRKLAAAFLLQCAPELEAVLFPGGPGALSPALDDWTVWLKLLE